MHARINDIEIPVESLKSVIAAAGGRILGSGAAISEADRQLIQRALSVLHKGDYVTFNVVTYDWKAISGGAVVTKVIVATKSKERLPFLIQIKRKKVS